MENRGGFQRGMDRLALYDRFKQTEEWRLLPMTITDSETVCPTFDKMLFVFARFDDYPKSQKDVPLFQERWTRYARNTLKMMNIFWYRDLALMLVDGRDYFFSAIENDNVWDRLVLEMKKKADENHTSSLFDWEIVTGCRSIFCRVCYSLTRDEVLQTFGIQ